MKARTLLTSMIPVVGLLVLASFAPPALADCPPPPGMTPPAGPSVTAQQVENGSASLREFALAAKDRYLTLHYEATDFAEILYVECLTRQEESPWRSGSIYLVRLTPDGRVFQHAKSMALSARQLNPVIYGAILQALGINPADLADHAAADAAFTAAAAGNGGYFNVPSVPGTSGYALSFTPYAIWLAGFDLGEAHLVPIGDEDIDYGDPSVTARDVVDRESLKAFVTEAANHIISLSGDNLSTVRLAFRDENGPWRHGSVYLYVLETTGNFIMFHAAFPDRFELRPLVPTVRDAVTGEFILPQVIEAAKSDPEGGFVEYYFDDPNDDTDRADIPKVGYAREFTLTGENQSPQTFIVGSGFYGRAPDVVPDGPFTQVEATVSGDAVEGLTVAFARSISGQQPDYAYNAITDANGSLSLTISSADGVSGYYTARASNADGEIVGQWHSIPLNHNQRQVLELPLGGKMKVVQVGPLAASKPVLAAETEVSGLAPNFPNPFNSATLITYHLSSPGPVQLVIYNVLGQPVRTLVDASQAAGTYQIRWDVLDQRGGSLSTGIYIARLSYPGGVQTQRLLYLK